METYLNAMAGKWKTVIVAGAGNEGAGKGHASGRLTDTEGMTVELAVSEFEPVLNVQLWKQYGDEFDVTVIHPGGGRITLPPLSAVAPGQSGAGTQRYRLGTTELLIYYGVPAPYSANQEIYLDFLPAGAYVDSGIWRIELAPRKIIGGEFDLWLPGAGSLNPDTGFLRPSPDVTLTIPSTAEKVITVGAYDPGTMTYAPFSGRGYTRYPEKIKPELAAPGVDITTASVGGGYASATGTSFAAPFVTAAAVLLMQWGIWAGNDPYLYGEKVKAYLIRGARRLPGISEWPNSRLGWGALCVRESFPI